MAGSGEIPGPTVIVWMEEEGQAGIGVL